MQSASNTHCGLLKKLAQKKYRHKEGKLLAEGLHLAQEALRYSTQAGFTLLEILSTPESRDNHEVKRLLEQATLKNIPTLDIDTRSLNTICDTDNPQGVAALLAFHSKNLPANFILPKGVVVYADRIQDPGNLGSLMRSCAAFDCPALLLGEGTVDWSHPKVTRSSMGALFKIPLFQASLGAVLQMQTQGAQLIAADARGNTSCYDYTFPEQAVLLVGNEAGGLQQTLLDTATDRLRIPMASSTESLNSAVSAAILLSLHYSRRHSV